MFLYRDAPACYDSNMEKTIRNGKKLFSAKRIKRALLLAAKVGLGSAAAIIIATLFGLQNPTAAGTITLLTLLNTKKGTLNLIFRRLITFLLTLVLCLALFGLLHNEYAAFGIFLIVIVFISELLDWENTLSVNALIGMHFLSVRELTTAFVTNEFALLMIGVLIAFALNQFYDNKGHLAHLQDSVRETEDGIAALFQDIQKYLNEEAHVHPWNSVEEFHRQVRIYEMDAAEYESNSFSLHAGYFRMYFEMRSAQLVLIENLHVKLRRIRQFPEESAMISGYVADLIPEIYRKEPPELALNAIELLLDRIVSESETEESFADRALMFHILIDLKDLLEQKERFLRHVTAEQRRLYIDSLRVSE